MGKDQWEDRHSKRQNTLANIPTKVRRSPRQDDAKLRNIRRTFIAGTVQVAQSSHKPKAASKSVLNLVAFFAFVTRQEQSLLEERRVIVSCRVSYRVSYRVTFRLACRVACLVFARRDFDVTSVVR